MAQGCMQACLGVIGDLQEMWDLACGVLSVAFELWGKSYWRLVSTALWGNRMNTIPGDPPGVYPVARKSWAGLPGS